jgi:hypothetical protein
MKYLKNKKMSLVLIELNEINFDVVKRYIDSGVKLPGFSYIINNQLIETSSESKYDLLEPWIQWPSVHTGLDYSEHQLFRLGDSVNSEIPQIFEKVEQLGFSVGAVCPMNARNALINPKYFIPDPWTKTKSDNSFFSKAITQAISQAVNDNSESKLSLLTLFNLTLAFIFLVHPSRYLTLIKYALLAIGRSWRKALFLDKFLYEIHKTLFRRKAPKFSTLFLNAGAHIQHHYFFNSEHVKSKDLKNPVWYIGENEDPFLEMILEYDLIIEDILAAEDTDLIIATGLSQKPFTKVQFYYRLLRHEEFLKDMGISFSAVHPRMTRDFLITFDSVNSALDAETKLKSILVNNEYILFDEIDNRGKDLFVVLSYPYEINEDTFISINDTKINLEKYVVFVAIKNGMHDQKGYAYFSPAFDSLKPKNLKHVSNIHDSIINYFKKFKIN